MTRLNKTAFILLLLYTPLSLFAQQDLLDFNNSLKFARYLKTTRQLSFAAQEYERLNFLWPNDSIITIELVQTYRLNNQCDKFASSFKLLSNEEMIYKYRPYTYEYLRFSLNCRNQDPNYFTFSSLLDSLENSFFVASYYWVNKQHDKLFDYYSNESMLISQANADLYKITKAFYEQKYKSTFTGVLMSAVIPGSGKAYTNRWGDAFVSFLFVGTNAYAAYRAFNKKGVKSVNGWIFGGLAFSFYTANLWGTAKGVKNYNNNIKERYQNNAENIIYNSY